MLVPAVRALATLRLPPPVLAAMVLARSVEDVRCIAHNATPDGAKWDELRREGHSHFLCSHREKARESGPNCPT